MKKLFHTILTAIVVASLFALTMWGSALFPRAPESSSSESPHSHIVCPSK